MLARRARFGVSGERIYMYQAVDEAEHHGDERRSTSPRAARRGSRRRIVVVRRAGEEALDALPELVEHSPLHAPMARRRVVEQHDAGKQRAGGQHVAAERSITVRRFMARDASRRARRARLAVEGHEDQPPRIEAGEQRRDDQQPEGEAGRRIAAPAKAPSMIASLEKKPAMPRMRARNADAGQRQRADDHHPVGHRDLLAQAAHVAHVLLVGAWRG